MTKKPLGLTLIELTITLSILSISLSIGLPSSWQWLQKQQLENERSRLKRVFSLARSEAITRGTSVTLCPSNNETSCTKGFIWHNGWILFQDSNNSRQREKGEPILRADGNTTHIRILSSVRRQRIRFYLLGNSSGSNATFSFCSPSNQVQPKYLVMSNQGRTRYTNTHPNKRKKPCSV